MKPIQYTITTSPFKQSTVLFQLFIAIGIPFGILLVFLWVIKAWEGMILVGLLLVLSAIVSLIIYGKYSLHYVIDDKGIRVSPSSKQRRTNMLMNRLTIIAGIIAKNPTVMAAGLLANSHQNQYFAWKDIRTIKTKKDHVMLINHMKQRLVLVYPKKYKQDIKNVIHLYGKDQLNEMAQK